MTPSNGNVVRFVATFVHGPTMPFTHLILGYGYQSMGGLNHKALAQVYGVDTSSPDSGPVLYAGYLSVEDGEIKVFSGGSMTMGISDDPELNAWILEILGALDGMKQAVLTMMTRIMAGEIKHMMIAQQ